MTGGEPDDRRSGEPAGYSVGGPTWTGKPGAHRTVEPSEPRTGANGSLVGGQDDYLAGEPNRPSTGGPGEHRVAAPSGHRVAEPGGYPAVEPSGDWAREPMGGPMVAVAPVVKASGWWALGAPALVGGVAVAAAVLVHFHDPHVQGSYGVCPFYALTGWWCPGCGGLRAMHNLTEGRILDAVHSNAFLLPLILGFTLWWGDWMVRRWRGRPGRSFTMSRTTLAIVLTLLAAFTVLRNTPWGAWLAPV